MTKDLITVELIHSERDPHWTSPAQQGEYKKFFFSLTRGDFYSKGVDPRALKIDKHNIKLMGEFHIVICDLWSVDLRGAVVGWLEKQLDRKIRIEFQEFEATSASLADLNSILDKFARKKMQF